MKAIITIPDDVHEKLIAGGTRTYLSLRESGYADRQARFWSKVWNLAPVKAPGVAEDVVGENELDTKLQMIEQDDGIVEMITRSPDIKTLQQALDHAEVDLKIYEVDRFTVNSWQVTMKLKGGKDEPDKPVKGTNYQVKVWLRPKTIAKRAMDEYLESIASLPARPPVKKVKMPKAESVTVELAIYDFHWAMYAWRLENGYRDWDLKIQENVYNATIDYFLDKLKGKEVTKFILPLGHDLFHMNDQFMETPKSKNRLQVDGRLPKIIETAKRAVLRGIERCGQIADVDVMWIPGNHDYLTSLFMCYIAQSEFRKSDHIEVDISPNEYKYRRVGTNLLGFNHGENTKENTLPLIMLEDNPVAFGECEHREWHIGHFHTVSEKRFEVGLQQHSCRVRRIPTHCPHDQFAHGKGFPKSGTAAEAYIWSPTTGYDSHINCPTSAVIKK